MKSWNNTVNIQGFIQGLPIFFISIFTKGQPTKYSRQKTTTKVNGSKSQACFTASHDIPILRNMLNISIHVHMNTTFNTVNIRSSLLF
ncbi:MAG: ribosomal protein S19 family protein [Clostridiales bacterium]|nr:ribosomal protein S19 family protein [Clostridiales bacterium]